MKKIIILSLLVVSLMVTAGCDLFRQPSMEERCCSECLDAIYYDIIDITGGLNPTEGNMNDILTLVGNTMQCTNPKCFEYYQWRLALSSNTTGLNPYPYDNKDHGPNALLTEILRCLNPLNP